MTKNISGKISSGKNISVTPSTGVGNVTISNTLPIDAVDTTSLVESDEHVPSSKLVK